MKRANFFMSKDARFKVFALAMVLSRRRGKAQTAFQLTFPSAVLGSVASNTSRLAPFIGEVAFQGEMCTCVLRY